MRALALPRGERFAVLTGALLVVLIYPPFHLFVPSFICLVPAVWLIITANDDPRPVKRQLVQGFWYGLAANGLLLYWMVIALWHFTPLSAAGYAATVLIEACWWGVAFAATGWFRRRTNLPFPLLFAVVWTAVEWAIGHQGDIRFPWLGLGTSLTHYLLPIQIAEVVGARGITFLLALANGALALAWMARRDNRPRAFRLAAIVAGGVLASWIYGAIRMGSIVLRDVGKVAAIQPNLGFIDKWRDGLQDSIVHALVSQSSDAIVATHPELVLWPEVAIPGILVYRPEWEAAIADQARRARIPLLVGALDLRIHPDQTFDQYNAAFLFDGTGRQVSPAYHKHYLVPIVERVPFINPRLLHLQWFGGFGVGEPGPVYKIPIGSFGVLICYESAFEDLARDYRRRGATFLVNITNDAWYGRTTAPSQHASHLVMRAIETRIGIARAGNSGISEFVDPFGREYHQTRLEERTAIADIVRTSDVITLYTRLGDWVGVFSVAAAVALGLYAWRRPR